jgi:hypothetical protein
VQSAQISDSARPLGAILWTIGKLREFSTVMVFRTSGVSVNLMLKSSVPFSRCSV